MEVNWVEISLNAFIAFIVASGVATYIRFKVKPKHEEVFEHNRNANLMMVFGLLNRLDMNFGSFVRDFEQSMGEFTKDRNKILPKIEWKTEPDGGKIAVRPPNYGEMSAKYEQLKKDLKSTEDAMKSVERDFRNDFNIFQNYIHVDFLREVSLYIFDTLYFSDWALKDAPLPYCLERRMKRAKKIIEYVEKDKGLDQTFSGFNYFRQRWNEEFIKFPDLLKN